jgi:hypothetical protein
LIATFIAVPRLSSFVVRIFRDPLHEQRFTLSCGLRLGDRLPAFLFHLVMSTVVGVGELFDPLMLELPSHAMEVNAGVRQVLNRDSKPKPKTETQYQPAFSQQSALSSQLSRFTTSLLTHHFP